MKALKANPIFQFFASLKLAVFSILGLAALLAVGTILESLYGTRSAQVMLYQTPWFAGALAVLFLNVLCAALSRYPWKKHQTGFVITHLGILILLIGSVLTQQWGVDGNLPVTEGQANNEVSLSRSVLSITPEASGKTLHIPFAESGRSQEGKLLTLNIAPDFKLIVDKYYPRSRARMEQRQSPTPGLGVPAVQVSLFNSRFSIQEWLIPESDPSQTLELPLGPATLRFTQLWNARDISKYHLSKKQIGRLLISRGNREFIVEIKEALKKWVSVGLSHELRIERYLPYAAVKDGELINKSNQPTNPALQVTLRHKETQAIERHTVFSKFPELPTRHRHQASGKDFDLGLRFVSLANQAQLHFAQSPDNKALFYRILSRSGRLTAEGTVKLGKEVETGWMDLRFRVDQWYPHSVRSFVPKYVDQIQGNQEGLISAIHLTSSARTPASSPSIDKWLIDGYAETITHGGKRYLVKFGKRTTILPFNIHLEKFTVGYDPGTQKAGTYESLVSVKDASAGTQPQTLISMNEPLKYGGYTFYQASYQLRDGRPPISIFSVNWDPGRMIKYAGSLLLVLGICLMFYMNPHYWGKIFSKLGDKK